MKQTEILLETVRKLKRNKTITSVLLMGSVAAGTALPNSDLDLLVLGNENKILTETDDGILIKYLYITNEDAIERLEHNDMEVYYYLGSKIMYDLDGKMINLMRVALNKYESYKTPEKVKKEIACTLSGIHKKLQSAIENNDILQSDFITASTSSKIIEAIWAVNDKPIPPLARVIQDLSVLNLVPESNWFDELFSTEIKKRSSTMRSIIDWVMPLLNSGQ